MSDKYRKYHALNYNALKFAQGDGQPEPRSIAASPTGVAPTMTSEPKKFPRDMDPRPIRVMPGPQ